MNFKIHRGAKEIGGSCIEVWTGSARIVVDFGMPLVNADNTPFDSGAIRNASKINLIEQGILPDIGGLYDGSKDTSLILSHAHQDHYGLVQYINDLCPVYLGEPTHKLIQLTNTFTRNSCQIYKPHYFTSGNPFKIGDIEITPYLMDHAAFDAYAFLIKANGKSLFYSGDFRLHGRKEKVFDWFQYNVDTNVDYLFLEGTTIGRGNYSFPTENDLENEFVEQFRKNSGIHLVYVSGQNIDRLVSIYRACKRSGKILAIDFYIATVLKEIAHFGKIPHPSRDFPEIKVFYPKNLSNMIVRQGNQNLLYQFKPYKITKEQIDERSKDIMMTIRPSMISDLEYLNCLSGGTFIYSMWSGYRKDKSTKDFIQFLVDKDMEDLTIHTSGHADCGGLKRMADVLKPKHLVPIHTFEGNEYQEIFTDTVVKRVEDKESVKV
jgi:ribonuclease J